MQHSTVSAANGEPVTKSDDELDDTEIRFFVGNCHLFAIAVHRLTGLPHSATFEAGDHGDERLLVHAYVICGDHAIDIRGRFAPETVPGIFDTAGNCWEETMTQDILFAVGEGKPKLDEDNPDFVTALQLASALIDRLSLSLQ
ncbi:hypothetical protein ACU8KI_16095 [Rhizobium leguminosarum]